jgi:hypothetical protein
MNVVDAYAMLAAELAAYRQLAYDELARLVGPVKVRRVRGPDSTEYAIEVEVRWRSGESGDLLVTGWIAADNCGPMRRLDDHFIVAAPAEA